MFRKLTMLVCLISFFPAAAGAQEVALLLNSQPVQVAESAPAREVNLTPSLKKQEAMVVAANDVQGSQVTEAQRPRKTHTGLTFKEFAEVHWGEYRWIYWVGAVAGIVLLHALAFND